MVPYRDADFRQQNKTAGDLVQQVRLEVGSNRHLIVELSRNHNERTPFIVRAAIYLARFRRDGSEDLRMCLSVRRSEVQLIDTDGSGGESFA
jgi:hypothetical protein